MKLQKLVYMTHGWWLALNTGRIVSERPQVWRHGPVFPSLYHTLKVFGHSPIPNPQSRAPTEEIDDIGSGNLLPTYLDFVWERYGHLTSYALSDMTHRPGTPWQKLAMEYNFRVPRGLEIPDEYVREEFLEIYQKEFAASGETTHA